MQGFIQDFLLEGGGGGGGGEKNVDPAPHSVAPPCPTPSQPLVSSPDPDQPKIKVSWSVLGMRLHVIVPTCSYKSSMLIHSITDYISIIFYNTGSSINSTDRRFSSNVLSYILFLPSLASSLIPSQFSVIVWGDPVNEATLLLISVCHH